MPHIRKNGQNCPGRPYQEPTTMAILCATCREPVGPPPAASSKPKTIASSPASVNEMLRRRLHPEQAAVESPYAESIAASTSDAFGLIRKKTQAKLAEEARKQHAESASAAMVESNSPTAVAERPTKKAKAAKKGKKGKKAAPEAVHVDDDLLTSDDEPTVAPMPLPPSPSADIVTAPTEATPPLMAALQMAAAAGNADR